MVASDYPTHRCRMSHLYINKLNTRQPRLCRRQPPASHIRPPHTFPRIWLRRPKAPCSRTTFLKSRSGKQLCQGRKLLQRGQRRSGTCRGSWRAPFLPPLLHKGRVPCRAPSSHYLLASPEAPYLFIEPQNLSLADAAIILFIRPQKSMLYHPTTNKIVSTYHVSILACTCPLYLSGSPHISLNGLLPSFPPSLPFIPDLITSLLAAFCSLLLLPYLFINLTRRERGREHVVLISAQYLPYIDLVSNTSTFHPPFFF